MTNIKTEIDDQKLYRTLKKLRESIPPRGMLDRLGLAAGRIVKKRTREGKDVEGKKFQEYSEPYKKVRKKLKRPVHPVDMQIDDTAGMMASVDHLIAGDLSKVLVYIKNSRNRRIARYHNILGAGKPKIIRRFMGLNDREKDKIQKMAQTEIKELLRGL